MRTNSSKSVRSAAWGGRFCGSGGGGAGQLDGEPAISRRPPARRRPRQSGACAPVANCVEEAVGSGHNAVTMPDLVEDHGFATQVHRRGQLITNSTTAERD